MPQTMMNRGKFYLLNTATTAATAFQMAYFSGTAVGTDDPDLNFVADLAAVTGVTVSADRQALASVTVTEDDTNNRVNLDAATVTFPEAVGVTALGVAIYVLVTTDADSPLIATYTDNFGTGIPVDGGMSVNIPNDFLRAV